MFRSYVLIAAIALIAFSVLYLLLYQPTAQAGPALAPTGRLRQLGRWLVLLVPVVAAPILAPSALSGATLMNRGLDSTAGVTPMPSWNAANNASVKDALDSDPNAPVPVEVTDLITISQNAGQIKAFEGRKVRSVGPALCRRAGQGAEAGAADHVGAAPPTRSPRRSSCSAT